MTETIIIYTILAVLFLLDMLVTAVKASMSHARLTYLLNLREAQQAVVDKTVKIIEEPRLHVSLSLAMMFFHFLLAGLLTIVINNFQPGLDAWWVILYLAIAMTAIILVEYGIETLIAKNAEENAIRFRTIASLINLLFSPLSGLLLKILGPEYSNLSMASMTEEDLKNWVEAGQPEGSLDQGEREMIYSIFQFGDTLAKEIMVPRIDVLALDIKSTLGEARETFVRAGHSRVPVFEDTVDNVVGLLYAKDLLSINKDDDLIGDHRDLLRLAYFVPEAKKVDELLAEMQTRSMHMAIVVDEYGGVAGVVTLEDIVEEIIGEIRDEYDESEEMPFEKIDDDEYVFLGRIDLDIFNEVMDTHIATENADTIGGFIYGEIGDVPTGGEELHADDVTLTVDQVVGRRITKVRAKRDHTGQDEEDIASDKKANEG